ncbi:unnamed protein product [Acanthoscelides obtectus]|uniref:Uncharacterized protein n=1 Tax=Acanthoscelides obtectus TaxID=200917 RepID=A0A9P0K629_ACAOB|nr:unnamed protein product [Acanthoscelides obtectus]CAK1655523.1 hypothetical protein AOBTE_LOCUS19203 [Acanthoscelides obtectus]
MTLLFFEVFSTKINPLVCWQIQNGIFECVNCFFW